MRYTVVPRKENPKKSVVYFVGVAYAGFAMENEQQKNEAFSIEGRLSEARAEIAEGGFDQYISVILRTGRPVTNIDLQAMKNLAFREKYEVLNREWAARAELDEMRAKRDEAVKEKDRMFERIRLLAAQLEKARSDLAAGQERWKGPPPDDEEYAALRDAAARARSVYREERAKREVLELGSKQALDEMRGKLLAATLKCEELAAENARLRLKAAGESAEGSLAKEAATTTLFGVPVQADPSIPRDHPGVFVNPEDHLEDPKKRAAEPKKTDPPPTCNNCRFYFDGADQPNRGWCCRYPPAASRRGNMGNCPEVNTAHWCGEHQVKPESAAGKNRFIRELFQEGGYGRK